MRKRRFSFRNWMLMVLAGALFIGLTGFLMWNRKEEQETIQALMQEQQEMNGDAPAKKSGEEKEPTENPDGITSQPETTATPTPIPTEAPMQNLVSFRGDSFATEDIQEEYGYPAYLKNMLTENGKDVQVEDYTMDAAGSLSQMRLAGVEQSILDEYVAEHKKIAEEQTLRITETKIRDLSEEELIREDENGIPVICMGYYGGWCSNPEELCDQIQAILDTYSQQERYLILGLYPSWVEDREAYQQAMVNRWGEHYLQLDDFIRSAASSSEGRKEIAEAVYEKLTQMEYI